MEITTVLALLLTLLVGLVAGLAAGVRLAARDRTPDLRVLESRAGDNALVKHGLETLQDQMRELQDQRLDWQSRLDEQVSHMRHSTDLLRRETSSLATALRKPQVRGRWGELHLRRAVELAGLVSRCDFDEQVSLHEGDGLLRPDVVVHLAGGKEVVVDAKVPLDAFLDLIETDDDEMRAVHLARHVRQVRQHVDTLAGKSYWRSLPTTPEFVVLFVPGESFLSAALDGDAALIEYAAERKVILATPTTLIALLRTVAYGWTQQSLAEKARDIHRLARDLHDRLSTFGAHLDKLGRSLGSAVASYNSAVGSLESRVMVTARKLNELDVTDEELSAPRPVEAAPRPPGAVDLVEDERAGASGRSPGVSLLGVAAEEPA